MSLCENIRNLELVYFLEINDQSYDLWCTGDAGYVVQFNYQILFCQAYHSGQVFTAMPTLTGIPAAPTNSGNAEVPDYTPAVPRNIGSQRKNGALTLKISNLVMPLVFTSMIVSLVLL